MIKNGDNTFFEKITEDGKIYRYKFEYSDISIKPPTLIEEDD